VPRRSIDGELSKMSGDGKAAASAVLPQLRKLCEDMLSHLRSEEDHMQPIGRRYVPLAMHKKLVAKVGCAQDTQPCMPCHANPQWCILAQQSCVHCRWASMHQAAERGTTMKSICQSLLTCH
jgi:hemerythrin